MDIVSDLCLFEAIGPATLYHATNADNAVSILVSNRIDGKTSHRPTHYSMKHRTISNRGFRPSEEENGVVYGVSLTRSIAFARSWTQSQGVVFALDQERLKNHHRIVPVDYYGIRQEAEEFLVGSLQDLSRYLVAIFIPRAHFDELAEEDEQWLEGHKRYEPLLNHPLLRVVGLSWNGSEHRNRAGTINPEPQNEEGPRDA